MSNDPNISMIIIGMTMVVCGGVCGIAGAQSMEERGVKWLFCFGFSVTALGCVLVLLA